MSSVLAKKSITVNRSRACRARTLTFRVGYRVPDVAPPPCVATGHLTFGSLCSRYKITPEVIRRLERDSASLSADAVALAQCGVGKRDASANYLVAEFERRGVSRSRLDLLGRAPHFEFLETYSRIDIALDTFPVQRRHDHDRSDLARRAGRGLCRRHMGFAHQCHDSCAKDRWATGWPTT